MAKAKSEYEVEDLLLEKLGQLGYKYIELKNYDALVENFRAQITLFNKEALIRGKGNAELSESEFRRIMLKGSCNSYSLVKNKRRTNI